MRMMPGEIARLAGLDCPADDVEFVYEIDERRDPDSLRRGRFLAGWRDYTDRGKQYKDDTLLKLTWYNLGYRLGKECGPKSDDEVRAYYAAFAQQFISAHSSAPQAENTVDSFAE